MGLDLHAVFEPEETIGNLWHDLVTAHDARRADTAAQVALADLRGSLAVLLRALGGGGGVEIAAATDGIARFDGHRLRLPEVMAAYDRADLNRAALFWLTAAAALADAPTPAPEAPQARDCAHIRTNAVLAERVWAQCPGLRAAYRQMAEATLAARPARSRTAAEAGMERAIRDQLCGTAPDPGQGATLRYRSAAPVPFWLYLDVPGTGPASEGEEPGEAAPPPVAGPTRRKAAERRDLDQAMRRDSFIMHRFESILSWVESLNISRSIHDDDDESAQKAADDQDRVTLTKHDRKAATRLRLHLELSPAEADHERLAGRFTYPEWNHASGSYMPAHTRVLDMPTAPEGPVFAPDARRLREVRQRFEALHPRRILRPRQLDGAELDLDALIDAQARLRATGQGSDRVWRDLRAIERDLSVGFLMDTSRSTEAAIGDTCVIDVARDALAALAAGIDAAGDRSAIWGFSSLRRDRVFVTRAKAFSEPWSPAVTRAIGALRPGHYTRLGAAIRHASAQLAEESSQKRLLLILTDGKPNDLDHYEGQHGIEDSRMAVREARRAGQIVHGIIIDEDGQDWFARIFGRGGFTLLPHPERLPRALPDIYTRLTQET